MSFGWVLATPTGDVLAEDAGPCNGRGNFLRSEGAGMLTVKVFMALILKFTSKDSATLLYISDNQELVNQMTEHKNCKHFFPNEITKSDFNVTEQIYLTRREPNINATCKWIKGCQDEIVPIEELPIEAQLNIEADAIAGDFQLRKGRFRSLVHLLPSC